LEILLWTILLCYDDINREFLKEDNDQDQDQDLEYQLDKEDEI